MVSFTQSSSAGERKYELITRAVADILDWCEEVIETRKETRQGWFSGKAFTDLMEYWIDLSRKVSSLCGSELIRTDSYSGVCDASYLVDIGH